MYNWRLLLLAFFAVFQPIASFTERNLVDGRQECCDHRLERDSLYGNSRLKQPSEDHRLTGLRIETRELSRDERRHQNVPLSRSLHRRSIELRSRAARTDPQQGRESQNRDGIVFAERAISREVLRNSRTDRIRIASRREYNLDRESNSRITRAILESHPVNSHRETRHVQASIDEIRRNRDNRETHELRRTRDSERPTILNRRVENERSIELRQRHNERSVRSVDRISSDSNRFSLENSQERSSRTQSGENFRNENARRSIELRFRETQDTDRSTRRSTNGQQLKSTRDHRAVNRLDRRENEYKVRDVAERISLDQRAARDVYRKSEAARNYRSNEVDVLRDATNERVSRDRVTPETSQRRSVRDAERRVTRNDNRMSASMRHSEIRNTLSERQLNRQTSRMNDLQDRNNVRETERTDTINADRSKDNVLTRRIEIRAPANERNARESRERDTVESNRLSSRVSKRDISRVQRFVRNDERRDTRNEDRTRDNIAMRRIDTQIPKNERNVRLVRDRETSELNRMSPRMNEREIARERYNERDNERRETRNADLTREVSRDNMSTRRIAIRITNSRLDRRTRERAMSQPNRLTPRMNERETARDRINVRDNKRRETRDEDRSRDKIANMRRSDIRTSTNVRNERQDRERAASDSERLALRMNERHNVRDDERRATRNVDRTREVSRDNASTRSNDIRSSANERLVRERAALDSERLSFRMNERHSVRDDERRVTRNLDRTREVSRDNASMRLSDIRSSTSERLVRERAASDSERLSFRMNERHNVRDDERRVTRNVDHTREVSRDNASTRRIEIRSSSNERLVRERAASDSERLSFRMNERDNVRDDERRATRNLDRTREVSRDNASMKRSGIRSSTNERLVRERAAFDSERLSFRMNERDNVRDDERRATRNVDRTREVSRDNASMRRSDIRSSTNERLVRERAAFDSERLSFRMNERHNVRDDERRATRNVDRNREVSRDNASMRRNDIRSSANERLVRERAASDSERLSFRMNERDNVRDDERRATRNVDRNREVSRDNASMRRNDIRSSTNERLVRERTASDFERLSFRANERDNVRDNERRATRIADRTREVSRDNASMRRTDIRSSTNERLVRDRATSDSDRLSFRMNERHNVRDDERTATRNTDRTRDMSRDSVSMRRSEIRSSTNEKLIRERAASDSERLSFRMNERQNVRNIERTATRNSDRTREVSRDITMRRVETRSGVESARSHVVTISDKNIETETQGYSWHYLIYTLQAIYLCSMLMPMTLNKDQNNKKIKNIGWWASLQSAIKID